MSTKCQYQAAISNPIMWDFVEFSMLLRIRMINRKVVPINT